MKCKTLLTIFLELKVIKIVRSVLHLEVSVKVFQTPLLGLPHLVIQSIYCKFVILQGEPFQFTLISIQNYHKGKTQHRSPSTYMILTIMLKNLPFSSIFNPLLGLYHAFVTHIGQFPQEGDLPILCYLKKGSDHQTR